MQYRREIDGLRALAVLPVILFHAGFETFSGGFVGVDVFFVISGYLITTIIFTELEQGKFSIVSFYERRARRILPALFLVMLVCLPFAWLWLLPSDMKLFAKSIVAVSLFSSNILFWRESGYFDTAAELKPLLHTWSLAVEEQYYVLFPVFLIITWRFGKRWVLGALAVIAIVSLATAQWGSTVKPAATFFLLPTRGWELLIGAFVASYLQGASTWQASRMLREVYGSVGLAMLAYAVFAYSKQTPFPSLYALFPTVGTALIILFATQQTTVGRFIGNKAFVGVGLISYSAYLWHQPIFAFARQRSLEEPSKLLLITLAIASVVLAYFSYKYVESPFRSKRSFNRKQVFAFGSAFSVAFLAFGLVGYKLDGQISRFANDKRYTELVYRLRGNYGLSEACEEKLSDSEFCRTDKNPEVLLWGDSFAMHLAQGLVASNTNIKLIQTTVSQCAPVLGIAPATAIFGAKNCIDGNDFVFDMLRTNRSIKYAVLASPKFLIGYKPIATRSGVKDLSVSEVENELVTTLEKISELGVTPIVVAPPPVNGEDIGQCLLKAEVRGASKIVCNFSQSKSEKLQSQLIDALRNISNRYKVIWLSDYLCFDNVCKTYFDDVLIYRDGGHLSYEGSAYIGRAMNFYQLLTR